MLRLKDRNGPFVGSWYPTVSKRYEDNGVRILDDGKGFVRIVVCKNPCSVNLLDCAVQVDDLVICLFVLFVLPGE